MNDFIPLVVLQEALHYIPPDINRTDWLRVGMALRHEGFACSEWDEWSQGAPSKYKSGECERLWYDEPDHTPPVTGGTIIYMAKRYGFRPPAARPTTKRTPERVHVYRDKDNNAVMVKRVYRDADGKKVPSSYALTSEADPDKLGNKTAWAASRQKWERLMGRTWEQPLYALPALTTTSPTQIIHFVEGEGKADSLARHGFLATTVGGTGQSIHPNQLDHFRQREVIVWPDNDAVGKAYALRISGQLTAVAKSVKVIDIDALHLAEHGDIADVIHDAERGGTTDIAGAVNAIVLKHSTTVEEHSQMITRQQEDTPNIACKDVISSDTPEITKARGSQRRERPVEFIRWDPSRFLSGKVIGVSPEAQLAFVYAANLQACERKAIDKRKLITILCGRFRPWTRQQVESAVEELIATPLLSEGTDGCLSVSFVSENLAEIETARRQSAEYGKRGADRRWNDKR